MNYQKARSMLIAILGIAVLVITNAFAALPASVAHAADAPLC